MTHPSSPIHQAEVVYPIAPTPFLDDGAIDFESIDRLGDFYIASGPTGVTALGQLGEAPKLEHAEGVAVAGRLIRRMGRLPVVVRVSAQGFAVMRALTHEVMALGAAGVMIAPPNTFAQTTRSSATTTRPYRPSAPTCPSSHRTTRSRSAFRCRPASYAALPRSCPRARC